MIRKYAHSFLQSLHYVASAIKAGHMSPLTNKVGHAAVETHKHTYLCIKIDINSASAAITMEGITDNQK